MLLDFAQLARFGFHGPVCGKKEDRIEGDDCNRDVGPAPAVHIFVIERNDHVNASRSKLPSSQDTIRRRAGSVNS